MRVLLIFAILSAGITVARGQEQDRKLLDRLLKPEMSLKNDAQGKRFVARGETSVRIAPTKSFSFFNRVRVKQFAASRNYDAKAFSTKQSSLANQRANTSSRTEVPNVTKPYSASTYGTRAASEDGRAMAASDYPGTRPFLAHGKSQKALSAQDRALTIDEVRELLNKNK